MSSNRHRPQSPSSSPLPHASPESPASSTSPAVSVVHLEPPRKIAGDVGQVLRMLDTQLTQRKQQLFDLSVQIGREYAAYMSAVQTAGASVGLTGPEHGAWNFDVTTLEFQQTAPPPAKPRG